MEVDAFPTTQRLFLPKLVKPILVRTSIGFVEWLQYVGQCIDG
jgi:hypothetical protein